MLLLPLVVVRRVFDDCPAVTGLPGILPVGISVGTLPLPLPLSPLLPLPLSLPPLPLLRALLPLLHT